MAAVKQINGRPPYGFRVAGAKNQRRYIPDPQERAIMARIVEMKESGISSARIAITLWKEGIQRRNKKDWGEEAVRQAYHAELALRKEGPTKRCYACRTYKPLDKEHFHRNAGEKDGHHRICRPCRNRSRRDATRRQAKKNTSDAITKFERAVRKGGHDMESTTRQVVEHLGGPQEFARQFVDEFQGARAGSRKQVSMLKAAFRLADRT